MNQFFDTPFDPQKDGADLEAAAALARSVGTNTGSTAEQYHHDAEALVRLLTTLEACTDRVKRRVNGMADMLDLGAASPEQVFKRLYQGQISGGGAIGSDHRG